VKSDGQINVTFTVTNTGKITGDEVVQVYVKDLHASLKVPDKTLKEFKRITLSPGESQKIKFIIPVNDLAYYDTNDKKYFIEPGEFEIQVGSSSQDIRLKDVVMVE
ncbi:fibronectin type III-like domain-contianing protein, partial [Bacteroidota bacterium]